jgi:hypothetical protein
MVAPKRRNGAGERTAYAIAHFLVYRGMIFAEVGSPI